jgi:hypothetical protein
MAQDGIIIKRKVRSNFTVLDNNVIRDDRLSWKALGILTYLLSLPPDFKLYLKKLGSLRPSGRDSTRTGLVELQECGYLKIEKIRDDESGRFLGNFWEVTDTPETLETHSSSPETDFPNTGFPISDFPASENHTLLNTSSNNKELNIQSTTTTNPINLAHLKLSEIEIQQIILLLEGVDTSSQLMLVDELEGAIRGRSIKTSPVQWFGGLVKRYKNKAFNPSAGLQVAANRSRRQVAAADRERKLKPTSKDQARANMAQIKSSFGFKTASAGRDESL